MQECAREYGYALAVHGSLNRDIDLVAIPWVEGARDPVDLVYGLASVVQSITNYVDVIECETKKPYGRLAWSIYIDRTTYIDLSVTPRS